MKPQREEGFYKIKVTEFGPPFWTIGLYQHYGKDMACWRFAEGDGDEMSSSFNVLEIDEKMIMKDRIYEEKL